MKPTSLSCLFVLIFGVLISCDRVDQATLVFEDAISHGDLEKAEEILGKGADINHRYKESDGYTLLIMACGATPDESPIIQFLLEHGADPTIAAPNGKTALHLAAMKGRLGHVKALLSAGADRSVVDREGETPADLAQERGHEEIVRLLSDGAAG